MMSEYCRNCSLDLTDPTNCGFVFEGDWYCKPFCAEASAGFWSRGYELEEGRTKNGAVVKTNAGIQQKKVTMTNNSDWNEWPEQVVEAQQNAKELGEELDDG